MCHTQHSLQGWGTLCEQALGSVMALSGACSKLNPLFGRRHLLPQLLPEWSLPGAHSHHGGSLVYQSHSLSPETILPPAPCCPLSKVLGRQQTHSCILTRACGFVIAEERDPTLCLLARRRLW